jgi:N,N-dimethylformamidase
MGPGAPTGEVREAVVAELTEVDVVRQDTVAGSCVVVSGAARPWSPGAFSAAAFVQLTRIGHEQVLISQGDGTQQWMLGVGPSGVPTMSGDWTGGAGRAVGDTRLVPGAWYLVAGDLRPGVGLSVAARPLAYSASWRCGPGGAVRPSDALWSGPVGLSGLLPGPVYLGARSTTTGGWADCLDGKLEAPRLLSGELDEEVIARVCAGSLGDDRRLAQWDFAATITDDGVPAEVVAAVGDPALDGRCLNSPTRAATGHGWDGTELDFRRAPHQYGAVHFHTDDLDDCRWSASMHVTLPGDLPSGAYALRARAPDGRDERVPLFVRPRAPRGGLLVLVPTASYLAYANDHPGSDGQMAQAVAGKTPILLEGDLLMHEHREWGLSCYDTHADGSGVCYSSRRRPLLNMRPTHRYHVGAWQLPADLAVLSWIAAQGVEFDIAADEDLEREGRALLDHYPVVMTGTHPEYFSTRMLDALEGWLLSGGRLFYTGANGFYWRVAFEPNRPWVMEVRRGHAGSRAWESAPGETHLAATGERGGLWRHLGRPPQKIFGVGYAAQGFDRSAWYRRLTDSHDPRAAFIFDGVDGDTFGRQGSIGGGAVGQELDRYDRQLGTPHDALLLATSEGLSEGYLRCVEEVTFMVPGTSAILDPAARADMVYLVNPGGGAVFAPGSIAWAGALGVDPDVDRITANVLRRFLDPVPLPWSQPDPSRSAGRCPG